MSPEDELREKIKELESKLVAYEGEFQAVHTFLDAAGVMLPPGYEDMKPDELQRKSTCAGRVAQFIIAKTGCPFKLQRAAE
jgi:hypothetical protein